MNELDGVIKEFLVESFENLDQLDRDLVVLEKNPRDAERLASIFRTIHTIKGTCGFFEFVRLGRLTHAGENLLSKLRDGTLALTAEVTTALLALVDAVRRSLSAIEQTGTEDEAEHTELIESLTRLQDRAPAATQPAVEPSSAPEQAELTGGVSEGTIRVDVGLLDRLMNLVGELVLARNQALQATASQLDPALHGPVQRINLITGELQESVMRTRMQPIATAWNRLPRVARDLARALNKEVQLTLEGKDTGLDRSIIEAIKDPLTHLLRNALDHGIEAPATRRQRGKPVEGHVHLRAYHEGGQVNIEMSDDGAGVDPQRVGLKAVERGLISREQLARLGERELVQLIFLPGFSTAEKVTDLSGRGVGMDVVKTNIEKLGGTVDLQSRPGLGTTVRIKIPLTRAIIPALLVTAGGDRYAVPQASLLELVRLDGERCRDVEELHGAPVYRLRGNLLPLVSLARELGVEEVPQDEAVNIVVVQADGRPFGLVVDAVNDTEEIVVKPLGKQLQGLPVYAGATILGDGRVSLILDVPRLAQRAGVLETRERALPSHGGGNRAVNRGEPLLLLGLGGDRRVAVPLGLVDRLEETGAGEVEWAAGREVLQYRGEILPLVRLAGLLGADEPATGGRLPVIVCRDRGRRVGLVVERVLDIVEAEWPQKVSTRPGLAGSAVIQQRVTDLLDVPGLLDLAVPELVGRT